MRRREGRQFIAGIRRRRRTARRSGRGLGCRGLPGLDPAERVGLGSVTTRRTGHRAGIRGGDTRDRRGRNDHGRCAILAAGIERRCRVRERECGDCEDVKHSISLHRRMFPINLNNAIEVIEFSQ
jgi:hypothetical protein